MSIEYMIERPRDEAGEDRQGHRDQVREFTVKTISTQAPVEDADKMLDLVFRFRPDLRPMSVHPYNRNSFVLEPRVLRESRWLWDLRVPYSTEVDFRDLEAKELGPNARRDPLARRAKVTVNEIKFPVILTEDIHKKKIMNTAGDPFPDVEDDEYGLEINISKNVSKVEKEWVLDYPGSVNEESMKFIGIPFLPKTLLMTRFQIGDLSEENKSKFYPFSFTLTYRRGGWWKNLLNVGFREKRAIFTMLSPTYPDITGYRLERILDTQGEPVDESVFLDEKGRAYRVGVDPEKFPYNDADHKSPLRAELTDNERITLRFEVKRPLPFKKLPYK